MKVIILIAMAALMLSACLPLMVVGGANGLYGWRKDHVIDRRVTALEAHCMPKLDTQKAPPPETITPQTRMPRTWSTRWVQH
jgi:hypothetical protein